MTDLMALALRVEALTGSDREVDAEIACFIGRPFGNIGHWLHGSDISYHPTVNGFYVAVIPDQESPDGRLSEAFKSLEYTASLDAAMMLAPKGWKLRQMNFSAPCADDRKWHLNLHGGKVGEDCFVGRGFTIALALTSAALRARAAQQGDER